MNFGKIDIPNFLLLGNIEEVVSNTQELIDVLEQIHKLNKNRLLGLESKSINSKGI